MGEGGGGRREGVKKRNRRGQDQPVLSLLSTYRHNYNCNYNSSSTYSRIIRIRNTGIALQLRIPQGQQSKRCYGGARPAISRSMLSHSSQERVREWNSILA